MKSIFLKGPNMKSKTNLMDENVHKYSLSFSNMSLNCVSLIYTFFFFPVNTVYTIAVGWICEYRTMDTEGQLWDLSIPGVWCPQRVLEPIPSPPHGYQKTTVSLWPRAIEEHLKQNLKV